MPTVSLRLSDEELFALREWAHGSRRSVQREIVFRLFDGAVTERDQGRREVESGLGAAVPGVPRGSGSTAPLSSASDSSPRSVTATVPPVAHNVPMRAHMRLDRRAIECKNRVPAGVFCEECGAVGR